MGVLPDCGSGALHDGEGSGLPGTWNDVHLLDSITGTDDMLGEEFGLGEAAEVLEVDGVLIFDVIFDDSVVDVSSAVRGRVQDSLQDPFCVPARQFDSPDLDCFIPKATLLLGLEV